ncbi:EAL domain-containing protein [Desulfogranum japonicum]|uniref:EAL domain-containing protein n=1 Tax=Desulfogranum japonicum TaxID=231447 RepID=UPI0004200130|nr:EAL domain-containing protein [Desulfogranum japonicum]
MNFEDISKVVSYSIDNSSSGIVITDLQGTIVYINNRQCQTSGYNRSDLIGRNARIFQSGEMPQAVYSDMWTTILSGESWQGELFNRRKNGDMYWEHVHISPVKNHDGTVVAFLALKEEEYHHNSLQAIKELSQVDPLTGLLNKSAFLKYTNNAIRERQKQHLPAGITVYCIDIDRFYSINQNLGSQAADEVLVEVARRLQSCFRHDDFVARIGADIFAILLNDSNNGVQAESKVERLLGKMNKPFTLQQRYIFVTASIGIASFSHCNLTAQEVLDFARSAAGTAKSKGGDSYHVFTHADDRVEIEGGMANDLRHAIERNQFELYYQPQINTVNGVIAGVEALLRWHRNDNEMVPPDIFIPIAEKSELIIAVGEWVLRQAVLQIKDWRKQGLPWIKVAVNLSAKHFHRSDLAPYIENLLREVGLEPHFLELELTEGAVLQDPMKVKKNILKLKSIGVYVSLDDFGTGNSSLVWLSQLPVDQIKIDKSFVSDVVTNPVNASIVSATIAMAGKLDKDSIAEGVETEAQLHFLRRQGCDFLQGYLFSKPLPVDQMASLLQKKERWMLESSSTDQERFTILVVDDEPQIVQVLSRIFRRGKYRVLSAYNGKQALEILALNQVQIVISDHLMPGMTGVELLTTIKKLYPDTTRIILSGQSNVSIIIEAINQGAIWKYFTKPIETELLYNAVRKACQKMTIKKTLP